MIAAYDTLNNVTTADYTLNVALEVPLAPMIIQPGNGVVTNKTSVTVSGHAEKGTEVLLYNNGIESGQVVAVDALGNFGFTLTLVEGENRIQAAARYPDHTGLGPLSTEVLVTLDTTLPYAPTALTAQAKEGGVVKLTWQPPTETAAAGTNLYRAQTSIGDVGEAVKINVNLITAASFSDLPPEDGTWFYRATTVDTAGNESEPSPEATAVSDATAPRAAAVAYTPQGRFDPETGTIAPGTVDVVLTVSEPLQTTPYLSIAPEGGTPIPVSLSRDTDQTYTGFFVIADNTPTGAAYAIFSARDVVGNRGTEIDAGAVIEIDTDGPTGQTPGSGARRPDSKRPAKSGQRHPQPGIERGRQSLAMCRSSPTCFPVLGGRPWVSTRSSRSPPSPARPRAGRPPLPCRPMPVWSMQRPSTSSTREPTNWAMSATASPPPTCSRFTRVIFRRWHRR